MDDLMMNRLVCRSPVGAHYWPEWMAFAENSVEATPEMRARLAVLPWRRAHYAQHGCESGLTCTRCGCFCCYHEIGGRCFSRRPIFDRRVDPYLRDAVGKALVHRPPVAYFYCACEGMLREGEGLLL